MTTSQLDIQISAQYGKLAQLQPLLNQYAAMKAAAKEAKELEARIAELEAQREQQTADAMAQLMANIVSMSVTGRNRNDSVAVTITKRNGEQYTQSLRSLGDVDRSVLLSRYWMKVPADVRILGDTPEEALREYAAAKARGWFKG
jgi:hypothetical protein